MTTLRIIERATGFVGSMTGRLFLILALGVTFSAVIALLLADAKQLADFERVRVDVAVSRLSDIAALLDTASPSQREELLDSGMAGILRAPPDVIGVEDRALTERLAASFGTDRNVLVRRVASEICRPPSIRQESDVVPGAREENFGPRLGAEPACWSVGIELTDGETANLLLPGPPSFSVYSRLVNPTYLTVLTLGAAVLALFVSRMATAALGNLSSAATELGENIERAPLPERGPSEVRAAAHAFNLMQLRLRATLQERTQILAAITHDLQTPLTRMRLRVDKIEAPDVRERLVQDIAAMQDLISEGLELARAADTGEESSVLDLDSLIESLVEDALDVGHVARFASACRIDVRIQAHSLKRCLANLIDNAIQHGGSAEVACSRDDAGRVLIFVRDSGPGIPQAQIEAMFEPFARLDASRSRETGGTGLGLTISRTLAQKIGARLTLSNRPEGGLEARLELPSTLVVAAIR